MQEDVVKLKKRLLQVDQSGIALDIDETLSHTFPSWVQKIFAKHGNPEDLSVADFIKKYRHSTLVPYWQTPEVKQTLQEYVEAEDSYLDLEVHEGAHEALAQIAQALPIVAYITVRPANLFQVTKTWLEKNHLPQATIIHRPLTIEHSQGNAWKAEVLEYLYPQVLGIIDDNPDLIEKLNEGYAGTVYLYKNTDFGKTKAQVVPCKDWAEVSRKITSSVH